MGYSEDTPNYHLPQYVADDRPSYLGDWNEAMGIIDGGMKENKDSLGVVTVNVSNLTTRVNNMEEDVNEAVVNSSDALNKVNSLVMSNLGEYIIVYVSVSGNDVTGNGTKENPFQTVDKAISYCKEARISNFQIELASSGTYNCSLEFIQSAQVHFNSVAPANLNFNGSRRLSIYNCYISFSSESMLTVTAAKGLHFNATTLYTLNTTFSIDTTFNFTGSNIKLETSTLSNSVNIGLECCMVELLSCAMNTTTEDILRGYGSTVLINGATVNGNNNATYPIRVYGGVVSLTGSIVNNVSSLTGLVQGTRCSITIDPTTYSGITNTSNIIGGQCVIACKTNGVHWVDA